MALDAGTIIGDKFRIINHLGGGKPSDVYSATVVKGTRFAKRGARVAVKVFKPWVLDEPRQSERIRQELALGRRVRSPHVVRIHELHAAEPTALIMEFIGGQTLTSWMEAHPRPSADDVLKIARELAIGISKIHGEGMLHRDVKPDNIMISPKGVVLLDLGVVRPAEGSQLTEGPAFLGTIPYAAPEYLFAEDIDESVDVFSFGSVLHELALGMPLVPTSWPWSQQIEHKRRMEYNSLPDNQGILVHRFGFRVGRYFDWLLWQTLRSDPADRMSMDEVLKSLRRKPWQRQWPLYLERHKRPKGGSYGPGYRTGRDIYTAEVESKAEELAPIVRRKVCQSHVAGLLLEASLIGGLWPPKKISLHGLVSDEVDSWGKLCERATTYLTKYGLLERHDLDKTNVFHLTPVAWHLLLQGPCDSVFRRVKPIPFYEYLASLPEPEEDLL